MCSLDQARLPKWEDQRRNKKVSKFTNYTQLMKLNKNRKKEGKKREGREEKRKEGRREGRKEEKR